MNRIQINLLPPEVLEKRKSEKIISRVIIGVAVLFSAVFLAFLFVFQLVDAESSKLQDLQAQNTQYEQEIAKIANFENNKIFVDARAQLVNGAVARKYSWSKWLNNLSLLIPNEVWLESLNISEAGAVDFAGQAVADSTARRLGQKSVAKWLVRLAELDDLSDVWLGSSTKSEGAVREPLADSSDDEDANIRDVMTFSIKATLTPLTEEASADPAPPDQGGQI